MKIPYSEIVNLLPIHLSEKEVAEILNELGLPIENTESFEDDIIFDIDIPFNRGDLLSIYEVSKQIAIYLDVNFQESHLVCNESSMNFYYDKEILEILEPDFAPLYYGLILKVEVKESDRQFQKRLQKMGFEPVNNVVDTTNFICTYFGQPMHAFDYARISKGKVIVKKSIGGEKFTGLDNKQITLKNGIGIIADCEKILAIAGIIGSLNSATTFQTDTVFLECAHFNYRNILFASKYLATETESSYRFKRKVPYNFTIRAIKAFCNLLKDDIKLVKALEYKNIKYNKNYIEIPIDFINNRLGTDVSKDKVIKILSRLQCEARIENNIILVYPSQERFDLQIKEDLLEEIARFIGYKNIKDKTSLKITMSQPSVVDDKLKMVKTYLVNNSFFECISTSFIESRIVSNLGSNKDELILVNAIKNPDKFLRNKIVFTLLDVYRTNLSYGFENINLFEVGKVFRKEGNNYIEEENICLISNTFNTKELKNFVENIFESIDSKCIIENSECAFMNNSFSIKFDNKIIGYGGEVKKNILLSFGIKYSNVYCVEFNIDDIFKKGIQLKAYKKIPDLAPLKIDISFVGDRNIKYVQIKNFLTNINVKYLNYFELIDVFMDSKFGDYKKIYTIRLYFQHPRRNLEKKEIQPLIDRIFKELKDRFNVVRR